MAWTGNHDLLTASQLNELNSQLASQFSSAVGYIDFGSGDPAMLHGQEQILTHTHSVTGSTGDYYIINPSAADTVATDWTTTVTNGTAIVTNGESGQPGSIHGYWQPLELEYQDAWQPLPSVPLDRATQRAYLDALAATDLDLLLDVVRAALEAKIEAPIRPKRALCLEGDVLPC